MRALSRMSNETKRIKERNKNREACKRLECMQKTRTDGYEQSEVTRRNDGLIKNLKIINLRAAGMQNREIALKKQFASL